jgi:hypothetical protein
VKKFTSPHSRDTGDTIGNNCDSVHYPTGPHHTKRPPQTSRIYPLLTVTGTRIPVAYRSGNNAHFASVYDVILVQASIYVNSNRTCFHYQFLNQVNGSRQWHDIVISIIIRPAFFQSTIFPFTYCSSHHIRGIV